METIKYKVGYSYSIGDKHYSGEVYGEVPDNYCSSIVEATKWIKDFIDELIEEKDVNTFKLNSITIKGVGYIGDEEEQDL